MKNNNIRTCCEELIIRIYFTNGYLIAIYHLLSSVTYENNK